MLKDKLESILEQVTVKKYNILSKRTGDKSVIYTRVSSQEQRDNNGSLEVQNKYCTEFAIRKNTPVKEYFGGTFESAKTDGRKEFKRMLEFVKKNKDVKYIIVHNYDRFSRSGAAAAQLNLESQGIVVKSVTQDIDTTTASGRLQENFFHMLNNFENRGKSDRTKINTREVMLKGFWPYATPMGYLNLNKKHRACFHKYIITDVGRELKKGFYLILNGKLTNIEIIERLRVNGVPLSEKNFRGTFSNPFYVGYVTGKLVGGKLIKGKHPALVDIKIFMKVQEKLKEEPCAGIPKHSHHDEVPLKIFARDEITDLPLTGYKTKGIWYYKVKRSAIPLNVRADMLNNLFKTKLVTYEYDKSVSTKLKKLLLQKIRLRLFHHEVDSKLIKKKITEKQEQLNKVEKKYILDDISREIYEKHSQEIKEELVILGKEMAGTSSAGSNFEEAVEKSLLIAQNISSAWVMASFENKQRLQQLIFPQGILYNKQKGVVRTKRVNSLFEEIPMLARVLDENRKGDSVKNRPKSSKVPGTGFEPAHPCERCHLKAVRLPISPPGLI